MFEKGIIKLSAFLFKDTQFDLNPLISEKISTAGGNRIGVSHADNHSTESGGKNGLGARWGPAGMIAGLQRDIDSRSSTTLTLTFSTLSRASAMALTSA